MADINVIVLPDGTEYPVSDYYLPIDISNPTDGQVLKYDATNHVWYNGNDAEGSSVFYGTSAPTSQLGANGNLYVKYTEGTGGASDTVDALYVKLDGAWCQISTGGGGGASSADQVSVDDTNLEYEADDVQEALEKIYKRMTLAEYEQLSHAEKYNGTIYLITDVKGANQRLTKQISNKAIASFETDLAENLINLEVAITATGGGGTPVSPIAINGVSQADISVVGKNLLNPDLYVGRYIDKSHLSVSIQDNKILMYTPDSADRFIGFLVKCEIGQTYTIKASGKTSTPTVGTRYNFTSEKPTTSSLLLGTSFNILTGATITATEEWLELCFECNYGSFYVDDCQIEQGTPTTYEPYNGTTETIPFGQTVYGGRLNVGSGVLTITHGFITYNSSTGFVEHTSGRFYKAELPTGLDFANRTESISNVATYLDQWNTYGGYFSFGSSGIYINKVSASETLTDFNTRLSNTPFEVLYPLETPTTIQLDSKQIQAIVGTNNVYADTGDIIDLKFILTVGKAIS